MLVLSLVMQSSIIRALMVDRLVQLLIDFVVGFLYSVLQVRHIFGLQKHMLPSMLAAAVLFLRLILPLNPLKYQISRFAYRCPGIELFYGAHGLIALAAPNIVTD